MPREHPHNAYRQSELVANAGGDRTQVPNEVTKFNGRRNSANYDYLKRHFDEQAPQAGIDAFLSGDNGNIEVQGVTLSAFNKKWGR